LRGTEASGPAFSSAKGEASGLTSPLKEGWGPLTLSLLSMFQKEEARRATGLLSLKGKRGTQG